MYLCEHNIMDVDDIMGFKYGMSQLQIYMPGTDTLMIANEVLCFLTLVIWWLYGF